MTDRHDFHLQEVRDALVEKRRRIVAEWSQVPLAELANERDRPELDAIARKMFTELQLAIDAIDRALADEHAPIQMHQNG